MKLWRVIAVLVLVAALVAFGWHWVAEDPGYVLVRLRGWRVQTTLVAAIVIVILLWAVLSGLWQLLRWPLGALSRRHRRISRQRFGSGLIALIEGRHAEAERDLNRAARLDTLRGPALLGAAEAALRRGEPARATEALDQASQSAPQAARVLRARMRRREGKPDEALALLVPEADAGRLTPGGWRQLALAAVAAGDFTRARSALEPLRKSAAFGSSASQALETRVLVGAIQTTQNGAQLSALWSQLPKSQRRAPAVVAAYARRAAGFGLGLAAMDELESALRREWSAPLVAVYGMLSGNDLEARMRRAEGWLDAHPDDPELLLTLGVMCVRLQLWGKAHQYLDRSIALSPSAAAWEALADAFVSQGDLPQAQNAYRNALVMSRGEQVQLTTRPRSGPVDTRPETMEKRDAQGFPRLG